MGGPRVTENSKRLIIDIWTNLAKSGKEPSAKQVLASAEAYIKRNNSRDIFLPKLRKVQLIIGDARKHGGELSAADRVMQEPWNLSTLDKYPIPPESIPSVLDIWRYSVNLGEPLTIRQAKWASRLYTKITDTTELWLYACNYANEELLSLISDTPMRNFELDSRLVMGYREVETIKIPEFKDQSIVVLSISGKFVFLAEDGGIIEEFLHSLPFDLYNDDIDYVVDHDFYLISLIAALPSSIKYFPDIETRMVYLRHLSYLATVDNLHKFKPEEIRDLILDLRKWVIDAKDKIDGERAKKRLNPFPFENIRLKDRWSSINTANLHPVDIYKRVGYTDYDDTIWEEII